MDRSWPSADGSTRAAAVDPQVVHWSPAALRPSEVQGCEHSVVLTHTGWRHGVSVEHSLDLVSKVRFGFRNFLMFLGLS
jgi:hypothetical protein